MRIKSMYFFAKQRLKRRNLPSFRLSGIHFCKKRGGYAATFSLLLCGRPFSFS